MQRAERPYVLTDTAVRIYGYLLGIPFRMTDVFATEQLFFVRQHCIMLAMLYKVWYIKDAAVSN